MTFTPTAYVGSRPMTHVGRWFFGSASHPSWLGVALYASGDIYVERWFVIAVQEHPDPQLEIARRDVIAACEVGRLDVDAARLLDAALGGEAVAAFVRPLFTAAPKVDSEPPPGVP